MSHIGTLEVAQESMVVLYDPESGHVVHMHHSVTFKGGKHPDRVSLEKDARHELSQAQPTFAERTALLHVDPASIRPATLYKVDVKAGKLVQLGKARI